MDEVLVVSGAPEPLVLTLDPSTGGILQRQSPGACVAPGALALLANANASGSQRGVGTAPEGLLCGLDGVQSVCHLSWASQQPLWKSHVADPVLCLVGTPDGAHVLAGGGREGRLQVWDSATGMLLRSLDAHFKAVKALTVSACGSYVVSGGADAVVSAWSLTEVLDDADEDGGGRRTPLRSWAEHTQSVTAVAVSGSSASLRCYSCGRDGYVYVYELASSAPLFHVFMGVPLGCLAVDAAAQVIYAGTTDGRVEAVAVDAGAAAGLGFEASEEASYGFGRRGFYGHGKGVQSMALFELDSKLASAADDGDLRIWDVRSAQCIRCLRLFSGGVQSVVALPRPPVLATGSGSSGPGSRGSTGSLTMPPLKKYKKVADGGGSAAGTARLSPGANGTAAAYDLASIFTLEDAQVVKLQARDPTHIDVDHPWSSSADGSAAFIASVASQTAGNVAGAGAFRDAEMEALREQLREAEEANRRWQEVNNKLLQKVQQSGAER